MASDERPALQIAPALATGCTVVLKPAPSTRLTAWAFCQIILEAGVGSLQVRFFSPKFRKLTDLYRNSEGVNLWVVRKAGAFDSNEGVGFLPDPSRGGHPRRSAKVDGFVPDLEGCQLEESPESGRLTSWAYCHIVLEIGISAGPFQLGPFSLQS